MRLHLGRNLGGRRAGEPVPLPTQDTAPAMSGTFNVGEEIALTNGTYTGATGTPVSQLQFDTNNDGVPDFSLNDDSFTEPLFLELEWTGWRVRLVDQVPYAGGVATFASAWSSAIVLLAPVAVGTLVAREFFEDVPGDPFSIAGGAEGFGITYSIDSGALPTGATLDTATGTVTIGTPAMAGTFNVTYRYTNASGSVTQAQVITVTAIPDLAIVSDNDVGQLFIDTTDGATVMTLTVSGMTTTAFNGTYVDVPIANLASGPIALVAPAILDDGTPDVGDVFSVRPPLWFYDTDLGAVTATYQWRRDGGAITGAISETYTVDGADADTDITITVTGTQPVGPQDTASTSAPVSIPAAETAFTYSLSGGVITYTTLPAEPIEPTIGSIAAGVITYA